MNYGKIYFYDTANGIGLRTCLFVSGCRNHCENCFQPETWNFTYGDPFTAETEETILKSLKEPFTTGLTILGGEPMEPENQESVTALCRRVKAACPDKTIWLYSGYTWEQLNDPDNRRCHTPWTNELLSLLDVLVDGRFVEAQKNIRLRFRGSENQRIIDVPQTLSRGHIVLTEYMT